MSSSDVDRGWAFVVLFLVSVGRFIIFGMLLSTPVLYIIFLDDLQESPVLTSWVVNLNLTIFFVCPFIGNIITRTAGVLTTAVLGCLISSAGLLTTSFVPNIEWMLFTFSTMTGIGYGFSYISHLDMVRQYLVKYRKMALACIGTGASLGRFAYTPLLFALNERFHWRGAFIILSAINLNLLLAAVAISKPQQIDECDIGSVVDEGGAPAPHRSGSLTDSNPESSSLARRLFDDFRLLSNGKFLLFIVSEILMSFAFGAFQTHMAKYSEVQGHTEIEVASLPTVISIMMFISRLLVGIVFQVCNVDVVLTYAGLVTLGGILIACYGLISNYIALVVIVSLIGICISVYCMYAEVVVVLVGVENLTAGCSFFGISSAIGFFCGGSVTAFIYQLDPSYLWSFLTAGLMHTLGGLIILLSSVKFRK